MRKNTAVVNDENINPFFKALSYTGVKINDAFDKLAAYLTGYWYSYKYALDRVRTYNYKPYNNLIAIYVLMLPAIILGGYYMLGFTMPLLNLFKILHGFNWRTLYSGNWTNINDINISLPTIPVDTVTSIQALYPRCC